jgi:hypothetical protein
MLDADQHLAGGRCRRFGKVGKLRDDSRLAESFEDRLRKVSGEVTG